LQAFQITAKYLHREAVEIFYLLDFQKSTKKPKFAALLRQFFYFVPRGTNVENSKSKTNAS